jgi:hypothetical protein
MYDEDMRRFFRNFLFAFAVLGLLAACAGKILQIDRSEEVLKNEEFENKVKIEEAPVEPPPGPVIKEDEPKKKAVKKAAPKPSKKVKAVGPRQPDIEDTVGFDSGRRPLVDPYRVGEKMVFNISYFAVGAGTLELETLPFAQVNGQKAYHFQMTGKSNSFFSKIYAVEDVATTYLSYDELVPLNLQISIKESKQLAETRTFFDWKTMKASYWQKKVTKEKGERSKKLDWDLLPYSQNVISAAYYMRVFKYELGKTLAFRVADEGKNIVFKGEVIRKEKLETDAGTFDTIVIKPTLMVGAIDGSPARRNIFKPAGRYRKASDFS